MSCEEKRKLWLSWKVMHEVARDRGYDVEIPAEPLEEFNLEKIDMSKTLEKPNKKLWIHWVDEPKLGKNLGALFKKIEQDKITNAIFIVDHGVTHQARASIKSIRTHQKIYIDVYLLDEAVFNISKHVLVPKHEICSASEKRSVLETYGVKAGGVPQIKLSDPMVRHLGAIRGQMIKITRDSDTMPGKKAIVYRVVS